MARNCACQPFVPTPFDKAMMLRAIHLARRGEGRVEPNPMVGCVIVKGDRVIGEGYHRRFGGPHAEVEALRQCCESPRGSTVYASLEPCRHFGKTPPCTASLIEAGVKRVLFAAPDPHDLGGGGERDLEAAGIEVHGGVCKEETSEVLAPWLTRIRLGRPYVIAKWAQSLDGKLATRTGDSKWISGEASREETHRLRARVDAILVGINTILRDDPLLTARDVSLRRVARRVVLDTHLRIPLRSRIVGSLDQAAVTVLTSAAAARTSRARRLAGRGIEVIACRMRRGRLSLADAMARLAASDATNLVVEGGGEVLTSFLNASLVDEAWVFVAPRLIGGGDAPGPLGGRGPALLREAIEPLRVEVRRCDADTLYRLRLTRPPE